MLSPAAKRNLSKLIPFGVIWLITSQVFLFVEIAASGNWQNHPRAAIRLDLKIYLMMTMAVTVVGLIVGFREVFIFKKLFRDQSLFRKILFKSILYIGFFLGIVLLMYPIAVTMEQNLNFFDKEVWKRTGEFLTSMTHLSTQLQLIVALFISLFYLEISDNIGHRVLGNFFTGKYHKPREELRIFLFSDMKSSTHIAEKLGHIRYFELLKDYYDDMSAAIIEYEGEVYQYVGDEIVISWEYEKGIRNNNCINCFFRMKKDIADKSHEYLEKYGVAPDFKSGLHFGSVTTGEIGSLRKDIIFTGDVLNATARIQGLCKTLEKDLLVSMELIDQLEITNGMEIIGLGKFELRGKNEKMEIATIAETDVPS